MTESAYPSPHRTFDDLEDQRASLIVTVDGPSGAGKSTMARMLACKLGFKYVDTGALYRAVGWFVLKKGLDPTKDEDLRLACESMDLQVKWDEKGKMLVFVGGEDITSEIRTEFMGMMASIVSAKRVVREHLWRVQRGLGRLGRMVFEGRDMGTRVFPEAPVRFFLTADAEERARRRWKELRAQGQEVEFEEVSSTMMRRDEQDSSREIAPLEVPHGAIVIDTTRLAPGEVLELMVREVTSRTPLCGISQGGVSQEH